MAQGTHDDRGIVYPSRLPAFARYPAAARIAHAVKWFWIPQWSLTPGETSEQEILPFPACNLVIDEAGVELSGPATRLSVRTLSGHGWAVGALLRPAAAHNLATRLGTELTQMRDRSLPLPADLAGTVRDDVVSIMAAADTDSREHHERATTVFTAWFEGTVDAPEPGSAAAVANEFVALAEDPDIRHPDDLAYKLHVSNRTLQRLSLKYVGLTPNQVILRHRLQGAVVLLRADPSVPLADVAADLGYADHAHFTRDFTATFGLPPSEYRSRA